MRVAAALSVVCLLVPVTAFAAGPGDTARTSSPASAGQCRPITAYVASKSGVYGGQRLMPRKLTELPPATAFMAVFRHIGGCDAPLTMVDYRKPRER